MDQAAKRQGGGVFITRGVSPRISNLSFSIGSDGSVTMSQATFSVRLDMSAYWFELAVKHLDDCRLAHQDLRSACDVNDEPAIGAALERECMGGMQAVASAAIALDALYASSRDRAVLPAGMIETWRRRKTARYMQVSEVLRRTFSLRPGTAGRTRTLLREIYRFRDLAVHPSGDYSAPVQHPVVNSGVEWRFVSFGFGSAKICIAAAFACIKLILDERPKRRRPGATEFVKSLSDMLGPILSDFESRFGVTTFTF